MSFMTPCAFELLRKINEREDIVFSPLTTRSLEQYYRVDFFDGKSPELALAANGGILLENGVINKNWFEESKNMISNSTLSTILQKRNSRQSSSTIKM